MRSSWQLGLVLASIVLGGVGPAVLNYVMDPYQVFRPKPDGLSRLRSNTRFQNAGLIRSYLADPTSGFDTVLIGSSQGQCFAQSQIQDVLGTGRVLKLNMPGVRAKVIRQVMQRVLQEPTVRTVIWELNNWYGDPNVDLMNQGLAFPEYLYGSVWGFGPYLFNVDLVGESMVALRSDLGWGEDDLAAAGDDYLCWYTDADWTARQANLRGNRDSYIKLAAQRCADRPATLARLRGDLGADAFPSVGLVIEIVEAHPHVEFIFYRPPQPTLKYATFDNAELAGKMFWLREAVMGLSPLANARVFAFDTVEEVVLDLDRFMDMWHYHPEVNGMMVHWMASDAHALTASNIDDFERQWYTLIRETGERALAEVQ